METQTHTQTQSNYQKYIKPRLENDPEFRDKHNKYTSAYLSKKYKEDEDYRKKCNEYNKRSKKEKYDNDELYRKKKREQALNRYYEKKALREQTVI